MSEGEDAQAYLQRTLGSRIMYLDGGMGTMIQREHLEEADFRGVSGEKGHMLCIRYNAPCANTQLICLNLSELLNHRQLQSM